MKMLKLPDISATLSRKRFFIVVLVCIHSLNGWADSGTSRPVVFYDIGLEGGWIPYQRGAKPGLDGVFKQVMDALERNSELQFQEVYLPAKRAEKALIDGIVDFDFNVVEWMPEQDYGESKYVLSDTLFSITEYVVTLNDLDNVINERVDYYGKPIGTVAGYFYFDSDKFIKVEFLSESLLMKGLQRRRFDAIIMEKESARYWASIYDMKIRFAVEHTKGFIRIRMRKQRADLMPEINQAIKTIINNGELKLILEKHQITDALPTL